MKRCYHGGAYFQGPLCSVLKEEFVLQIYEGCARAMWYMVFARLLQPLQDASHYQKIHKRLWVYWKMHAASASHPHTKQGAVHYHRQNQIKISLNSKVKKIDISNKIITALKAECCRNKNNVRYKKNGKPVLFLRLVCESSFRQCGETDMEDVTRRFKPINKGFCARNPLHIFKDSVLLWPVCGKLWHDKSIADNMIALSIKAKRKKDCFVFQLPVFFVPIGSMHNK